MELTVEQRAWSEYLAWTRNAAPWQYVETEERAWHRLERQLIVLRLRPYSLMPLDYRQPANAGEGEWCSPEADDLGGRGATT